MTTMTNKKFWTITEPLGWGTLTTDTDKVEKQLVKTLTLDQIEALRDKFDELKAELYDVLDSHVHGCGDDGFDDLLSHIIGLGRSEFEACKKDPKRARKIDYTESFSYCIPHVRLLKENLDPEHYVKWAKKEQEQFSPLATHPLLNGGTKHVHFIITSLQRAANKEWDKFVRLENKTRTAMEKLQACLSAKDAEMRQLGYVPSHNGSGAGAVRNPHGVYNLFHDVNRYMVG